VEPTCATHKKSLGHLPESVGKSFAANTNIGVATLLCTALFIIILVVYLQVGSHQFLNFDDDIYVTKNPHVASGISKENIAWAFTSVESYNWHPITWIAHMSDVQLYGMNPRGHHLTNVAFHMIATMLLFLLLLRLTAGLWQSIFVAAMFALHPLHVESVAWIAERKDLLGALFWFLTLLFYAEYVARSKPALYILTLFSFILGLMSKPMLVTLPVIMLLLDYWPLKRFCFMEEKPGWHQFFSKAKTLVVEKIPFFACTLFSCLITIYAQQKGGAIAALNVTSIWLRIENALVAYTMYIGKTLWPQNLAIYYPLPAAIPLWQVLSSLLLLLLLSFAALRTWRRHPCFAVGWLWFLITLLPVIGIIQVGGQAMADRYMYLPAAGLFIMAAWGVPELTKGMRYQHILLALLAGVVVVASAATTWCQLGYWQDNISIYQHTLKVTSGSDLIHNNLGLAFANAKDTDAAIREYMKALKINPDFTDAHNNLGIALETRGNLAGAIQEYQEILRITPDNSRAHYNMGNALQAGGNPDAAIKEYWEALRIKPDYANARNNLGVALSTKGDLNAAIEQFQETLRISPGYTNASINLADALSRKTPRTP
jgi:tetratricopeptide (TPR) repeat protein